MSIIVSRAAAIGLLGAALLLAPLASVAQEAQAYRGMILSQEEGSVMVRTTSGDKRLLLDPDTKIQAVAGSLGVRRKSHQISDLIRGLAIDFTAVPAGEDLLAREITFKPSALKTAKQIEAGLYDTEGRVAENADRIDNVGDLVAKERTKVFFGVGKYTISPQHQQELKDFAAKAKATKGYRLAVVGRADPSGDAAANRRLSLRRAEAVKAYLVENCGVLPGRIVPSTALGESTIAEDPDPPRNDAEARRVTVTIMVSKSARPSG